MVVILQEGSEATVGAVRMAAKIRGRQTCIRKLLLVPLFAICPAVDYGSTRPIMSLLRPGDPPASSTILPRGLPYFFRKS